MSNNPPEGCVCASFWTVKQKHKPDCLLNQSEGSLDLEKLLINGWYLKRESGPWADGSMQVITPKPETIKAIQAYISQQTTEARLDELSSIKLEYNHLLAETYITGKAQTIKGRIEQLNNRRKHE